ERGGEDSTRITDTLAKATRIAGHSCRLCRCYIRELTAGVAGVSCQVFDQNDTHTGCRQCMLVMRILIDASPKHLYLSSTSDQDKPLPTASSATTHPGVC